MGSPSDPASPEEGNASTMDARSIASAAHPTGAASERHYLLVFEGDSSWMFALPEAGEVVLGRGDGADLKLQDGSISRAHARVSVGGGQVRVSDLGSQNGTRVNEERVAGTRRLASGDVLTLCGVTLVLHLGSSRATTPQLFVDAAGFRQRVDAEVERALRYTRPFSLLHVTLPEEGADRARAELAVRPVARRLDLAAWLNGTTFNMALPELDAEAAHEQALLVVEALPPGAAVGVASCPADGCDVDTLQASAAAAAQAAEAGQVKTGQEAFRSIPLGDRTLIVADPVMARMYGLIERIAKSSLPVLVTGETGSGKEPRPPRSITSPSAARSGWSRSTARRSRRACSSPSSSATRRAPSPRRLPPSPACWRRRTAARSSSTRWARCRSPSRQSSCARSTPSASPGWGVEERTIDVRFVAATNRDLRAGGGGGAIPRGPLLPPLGQHPVDSAAPGAQARAAHPRP